MLVALALLALAVLGSPARTIGTHPAARQVVAAERVHVWWNEDLTRVLRIEGLWSPITDEEFVRMRPERDSDCRIALLEVLTGEVHEYEFDRAGEIVLAHGWIMINQRDQLTLGGEGRDFGLACDPGKDALIGVPAIGKGGVTWLEWNAGTWERDRSVIVPTPARKCESLLSLALVEAPEGGAYVRYQLRNGRIERIPESKGAAGGELRFRQLRYSAAQRVELLFCE